MFGYLIHFSYFRKTAELGGETPSTWHLLYYNPLSPNNVPLATCHLQHQPTSTPPCKSVALQIASSLATAIKSNEKLRRATKSRTTTSLRPLPHRHPLLHHQRHRRSGFGGIVGLVAFGRCGAALKSNNGNYANCKMERLEQRMQRHAGNGCQPGSSAPDPAIAPSPSASPFATRGPVPGLVNWPHIDRDVAFAGASVASRKSN